MLEAGAEAGQLLTGIGTMLLAGGGFYSGLLGWRSYIDSRFQKAVDALGAEQLRQRVVAIRTIQRLSLTHERFREEAVEILTGYLETESRLLRRRGKRAERDFLFCLDGICQIRLLSNWGEMISLRGVWFQGLTWRLESGWLALRDLEFLDCNFDSGDLSGIDFSRCALMNCSFAGANCNDAVFPRRPEMKCSKFRQAKLVGTTLSGADLSEGDFEAAQLEETHLDGAILNSAKFQGASLKCVRCDAKTSFQRTDFRETLRFELVGYDNAQLQAAFLPDPPEENFDAAFDSGTAGGKS
jgi:hypothetical protein